VVRIVIRGCENPRECMKCVEACPLNIIALSPSDLMDSETVKTWKLVPIFTDLCNGCGRCIKACPNNMIALAH